MADRLEAEARKQAATEVAVWIKDGAPRDGVQAGQEVATSAQLHPAVAAKLNAAKELREKVELYGPHPSTDELPAKADDYYNEAEAFLSNALNRERITEQVNSVQLRAAVAAKDAVAFEPEAPGISN